MLFYFCFIIL